jgi:asparagine synthase (glutamine-hydrolysing)
MCGICGQFNFIDNAPVRLENVKRMTNALAHRGPDDEGYFVSGSLGLGFRRLSIIDLQGGRQPMSDSEESVWVVFNGEIYNFQELRDTLEKHGHVFRTKSDTEVIVHGYKQWGVDVLERLNGMFGLAVWDEKKRLLMLARDRMGIKPLYYKLQPGRLGFGSEIRAVLAGGNEKPALDPVAINLFLRYRYTPAPLTVFEGIHKLAPGSRLIISNDTPRLEHWWNFAPTPFDPMPTIKQAEENLLELYSRAVKRQLISDVPLGLLLSGGMDSGLLLALMNEYGNSWKTYSVGFGKDYEADELAGAACTAKQFHAQNFGIELDRQTFEATLPKVIGVLEEPVAAPSVVPMYHLCQRAREDVKVVFMGQGPDELLGGYKRHLGVHYGAYWRPLPQVIRAPLGGVLARLSRNETVKRALYSLDVSSRMQRYQQVFSLMPGETIDHLFQKDLLTPNTGDRILECWRDLEPLMQHTDELGGLQFLEIRSSLPDELLMYGDKLSMAHGLEARVPYLDHDIVEYVERLSASFKVHNGTGKWLHRRICRKFLSGEMVRKKKVGFSAPVDDWFRDSHAGKLDQTLTQNSSLIYKYLRPEAVHALVKEHRSGRCDHQKILFNLIVLEEWLRHYAA